MVEGREKIMKIKSEILRGMKGKMLDENEVSIMKIEEEIENMGVELIEKNGEEKRINIGKKLKGIMIGK